MIFAYILLPAFVAAMLLVVVTLCAIRVQRDRADFERRFPPISDVEFLARCDLGTNPSVALRVR